jgi:ABC-type lipoprotein export system ATPase subunit
VLTLLQVLNRDTGKTIVMVTHDPAGRGRASHTCTRQGHAGSSKADTAAALKERAMKYLHLIWAALFRRKLRTC